MFGNLSRGPRRAAPAGRSRRPALSVEALEDRLTPSLSDPFLLTGDAAPAPAAGQQRDARIAAGADGFLTVWVDNRTVTAPIPTERGTSYFGTGLGSLWDIYAARLDAAGNVVDTTPIVVTQAELYQSTPRVAWNGQNWLVVWQTEREDDRYKNDVVAARIAPDGTVLDRTPVLISAGETMDDRAVWDVASDGSNWVVTWRGVDSAAGVFTVEGARVGPDGTVLDPSGKTLRQDTWNSYPNWVDIAFAGDEYLMTWVESSSTGALKGQLLTPTLDPIGGMFTIHASGERTAVASNGTDFLVTWIDYPQGPGWSAAVYGKRVSHTGQVLDANPLPIALGAGYIQLTRVDVAWDGAHYVVAFEKEVPSPDYASLDVFTARVATNGAILDPGGRSAVNATNHQFGPSVAPRPGGGAQVVWTDNRTAVYDVHTASVPRLGAAGPDRSFALGAPRQTAPQLAAGGNGFLAVFNSEIDGQSRVLVQRLDAAGNPQDAEPTVLATGASGGVVAWNGTEYLVAWTAAGGIHGKRVLPTGQVLDAAPFFVMEGRATDASAIGDRFLVAGLYQPYRETRYGRAVVVGGDGTVLGTPVTVSPSFARSGPRVDVVGGRWFAVTQTNTTHDSPRSGIVGAFVNPDGTGLPWFSITSPAYPDEVTPDVASSGDSALVVWHVQGDLVGRLVAADGTSLQSLTVSAAPEGQYAPAVSWDGTQYVVTWIDHRNEAYPSQPRGDVYATRVSPGGVVLDRAGFPVANAPVPEDHPTVVSRDGLTVFAYSSFVEPAPYANLRVTLRAATEFPAPQPPPAAPASLTATAAAFDAVDLRWSAVAGADGYLVERSLTGVDGWAQVGTVRGGSTTTHRDTGLTFDTTYFYRVRAYSLPGEGAYSPVASATTLHLDPPAAPTGLDATAASAGAVTVSWNDVATETGYEVERSADGGATWAVVAGHGPVNYSTWASIYDYSGVTGATTYTYRVRAFNQAGYGAYSNTDTVTTPISAPSGLRATAVSMTQIDLTWNDIAGESGYKVERSPGGYYDWVVVGTTGAGTTAFSDTGLVAGTTYHYRVRGYTPTADGDPSYSTSARTQTLPAPTGVTATAVSASQINLAWSDIAGEDGYKVERSPNGYDGWVVVGTTAANVTGYGDTGLASGTIYYYRVRGYTPTITGDPSSVVWATTPVVPPAAPAGLTATAISSSQIGLSWSNVTGETGYWVERSTDGRTWTRVASMPADVTTYTDAGLKAKTTYSYRVQAYNSAGAGAYSPVARATTLSGGGGKRLTAAAPSSGSATAAPTEGQIAPLLAEAVARWQAAGADTSALSGVKVRVADLPGATLGRAAGSTVWLDSDAAGWGWFYDSTPADDSEFATAGDQGEQDRFDLLTVLVHELGHVLGHHHEDGGVMAAVLEPGVRIGPDAEVAPAHHHPHPVGARPAGWLPPGAGDRPGPTPEPADRRAAPAVSRTPTEAAGAGPAGPGTGRPGSYLAPDDHEPAADWWGVSLDPAAS